MDGARAIALPTPRILTRYVVPNIIGPVVVYSTLLIPVNIIVESSLSFLGLRVQAPLPSWALLINPGPTMIASTSWMLVFPSVLLASTRQSFIWVCHVLRGALVHRRREKTAPTQ